MIANFKGATKRPQRLQKENYPNLQVENFMTQSLVTFGPDQPVYEVIKTLMKNDISGGPVIDGRGYLVGIISEGDCLKEVLKGQYYNRPTRVCTVDMYMTKDVITVPHNITIFEAAKLFLEEKKRRFPVIKEGKLIGQISIKDIMNAVEDLRKKS